MRLKTIFDLFFKRKLLIYADFMDPFSYIGFHNLMLAGQSQSVDLLWRGFDFNPDTPAVGIPGKRSQFRHLGARDVGFGSGVRPAIRPGSSDSLQLGTEKRGAPTSLYTAFKTRL